MKQVLGTCVLFLSLAGVASAQQEPSSWGVAGSIVPSWRVPADNRRMFDADQLNVNGSEFRIGFVRGRTLGGDWGVSLVRRRIDDGSTLERNVDSSSFGFTTGEFVTTRDVTITGVEVSKFSPFVTIKRRAQIGLYYGGGIGSSKGTLQTRFVDPDFTFVGNRQVVRPVETNEAVDAKELVFPGNGLVPLGRLEAAGAAIVAPGLKVRVSGGLAFPGMQTFSITGVYLFGAK
jgi:hypothetical protein